MIVDDNFPRDLQLHIKTVSLRVKVISQARSFCDGKDTEYWFLASRGTVEKYSDFISTARI